MYWPRGRGGLVLASYETVRGSKIGEDSLAVMEGAMAKAGAAQKERVYVRGVGEIRGTGSEEWYVGSSSSILLKRTVHILCQQCFTVVGYGPRQADRVARV